MQINELSEQGHGFIIFEGHTDADGESFEVGSKTYNARWERVARLYLMDVYRFTPEQVDSFLVWYDPQVEEFELEGTQFEPFTEEISWFLEAWNLEQIGEIQLGIINIQNIAAQKLPYPPDFKHYCWSEK
jgi:hypothetical protein